MALGAGAVGDDPEPGRAPAQRADRRDPEQRSRAVGRERELDDRDVEVADRADQLERVVPVAGLLDLVAVGEQPPDAQPDGGLLIDDQAASFLVHSMPRPGPGPR